MGFVSWFLAKLRNRRYAITHTGGRSLIFATIYTMRYMNFKNDPYPLIFVMYSGPRNFIHVSGHYTDAINLHYLSYADKAWFARIIYLVKKGGQRMDGRTFYRFLKLNRPSVIRDGYRRYHTSFIVQPKMVSAGWTHLYKLVYPFNDPYIAALNNSLHPKELNKTNVRIAYSQDELRNRINQTLNSRPISKATTSATTSGTVGSIYQPVNNQQQGTVINNNGIKKV